MCHWLQAEKAAESQLSPGYLPGRDPGVSHSTVIPEVQFVTH